MCRRRIAEAVASRHAEDLPFRMNCNGLYAREKPEMTKNTATLR